VHFTDQEKVEETESDSSSMASGESALSGNDKTNKSSQTTANSPVLRKDGTTATVASASKTTLEKRLLLRPEPQAKPKDPKTQHNLPHEKQSPKLSSSNRVAFSLPTPPTTTSPSKAATRRNSIPELATSESQSAVDVHTPIPAFPSKGGGRGNKKQHSSTRTGDQFATDVAASQFSSNQNGKRPRNKTQNHMGFGGGQSASDVVGPTPTSHPQFPRRSNKKRKPDVSSPTVEDGSGDRTIHTRSEPVILLPRDTNTTAKWRRMKSQRLQEAFPTCDISIIENLMSNNCTLEEAYGLLSHPDSSFKSVTTWETFRRGINSAEETLTTGDIVRKLHKFFPKAPAEFIESNVDESVSDYLAKAWDLLEKDFGNARGRRPAWAQYQGEIASSRSIPYDPDNPRSGTIKARRANDLDIIHEAASVPQSGTLYKGLEQPMPEIRLKQIKIFLSDEDYFRCLNFDGRLMEIEDYINDLENNIYDYNLQQVREIKQMIVVHKDWIRKNQEVPSISLDWTKNPEPFQIKLATLSKNPEKLTSKLKNLVGAWKRTGETMKTGRYGEASRIPCGQPLCLSLAKERREKEVEPFEYTKKFANFRATKENAYRERLAALKSRYCFDPTWVSPPSNYKDPCTSISKTHVAHKVKARLDDLVEIFARLVQAELDSPRPLLRKVVLEIDAAVKEQAPSYLGAQLDSDKVPFSNEDQKYLSILTEKSWVKIDEGSLSHENPEKTTLLDEFFGQVHSLIVETDFIPLRSEGSRTVEELQTAINENRSLQMLPVISNEDTRDFVDILVKSGLLR
jgi:hypothetical protein